jgi:hypothetical protein
MKKLFLIIATVTIFAGNGIAQENNQDTRDILQFGGKAGMNLSRVYDVQGASFVADPKVGFATGGFVAIPFGKYLGIQPEILFSQKGYKSPGTFLGASYDLTHTSSYLDLPLLAVFKPSQFVTLLAGPQVSFLLNERDVFTSGDLTIDQEQQFDNSNIRKNTLCFTGGFDINISHLVFGARAGWDIQNNNGDGTATNPRYKNIWYQATLGIRFY